MAVLRATAPAAKGGSPHRGLTRDYAQDVRLFRTRGSKIGLALLLATYVLLPTVVHDDFWLSVLIYSGVTAIGAIGLNLLTGFCGQVSLGHAFFIGVGAYTAAGLGGGLGLPMPVWLLGAAVVGGAIGALVGPFALRLRGLYLAIVTLGLVFVGEHLWRNLTGLTGGNQGTSVIASAELGPLDFSALTLAGEQYSRNQGWFWLVWGVLLVIVLLARNLVRTRPGRAMQAVRDRDIAAEVIGVSAGRYKIGAFAVSSAIAAVAGSLFGAYQQYVSPEEWGLILSVQYIAVIIVGGLGTVFGSVLGALFVGALPALIDRFSGYLPGVGTGPGDAGFISVFALNQAIFGLLIVFFLVVEPRGLAGIWLRIKAYFTAWPFSY
ncbi:MAG: branched-chain amino acid ABC transporter permease [Pseudonocardia sp.]|nr:branched-chain amino acid ABC transporter permease [Pseudonocardia sp.]